MASEKSVTGNIARRATYKRQRSTVIAHDRSWSLISDKDRDRYFRVDERRTFDYERPSSTTSAYSRLWSTIVAVSLAEKYPFFSARRQCEYILHDLAAVHYNYTYKLSTSIYLNLPIYHWVQIPCMVSVSGPLCRLGRLDKTYTLIFACTLDDLTALPLACLHIVSWGNFGQSLRNHFGRINNV